MNLKGIKLKKLITNISKIHLTCRTSVCQWDKTWSNSALISGLTCEWEICVDAPPNPFKENSVAVFLALEPSDTRENEVTGNSNVTLNVSWITINKKYRKSWKS